MNPSAIGVGRKPREERSSNRPRMLHDLVEAALGLFFGRKRFEFGAPFAHHGGRISDAARASSERRVCGFRDDGALLPAESGRSEPVVSF